MPITVDWFDPDKTTILLRFTGKWNWRECHEVFENELTAMLNEVPHNTYIIADLMPSTSSPVNGVTHARKLFTALPPKWLKTVVVSNDKFIQVMVDVFRKMHFQDLGNKITNAESLDEALKIIRDLEKEISREN